MWRGFRSAILSLRYGSTSIPRRHQPKARPLEALGHNMIVFDVSDPAVALRRLQDAGGIQVAAPSPMDGGQIAFGRDPDGNLIGFFRPGSDDSPSSTHGLVYRAGIAAKTSFGLIDMRCSADVRSHRKSSLCEGRGYWRGRAADFAISEPRASPDCHASSRRGPKRQSPHTPIPNPASHAKGVPAEICT